MNRLCSVFESTLLSHAQMPNLSSDLAQFNICCRGRSSKNFDASRFKNIEPFGFYEGFTDTTLKFSFFTEKFSQANISRMAGSNNLKFFVEVHRDELYLPLKRSELFKIRTQALFVTTLFRADQF